MEKTYLKAVPALLSNMALSKAFKEALARFDQRDALDALREAELLVKVMKMRWDEIISAEGK